MTTIIDKILGSLSCQKEASVDVLEPVPHVVYEQSVNDVQETLLKSREKDQSVAVHLTVPQIKSGRKGGKVPSDWWTVEQPSDDETASLRDWLDESLDEHAK